MYYKGTEQECIGYNTTVTAGENYNGTTTHWASPIYSEGNWYISKHESYSSSMELVSELPLTNEIS